MTGQKATLHKQLETNVFIRGLQSGKKTPHALQQSFPKLQGKVEGADQGSLADVVLLGGSDGSMGQPNGMSFGLPETESADDDPDSQFFRSSVIVPKVRGSGGERLCRMVRRREINELTMRMAVGDIGGVVEERPAVPHDKPPEDPKQTSSSSTMLEDWENRIELWANVRKVADRALGSVMLFERDENPSDSSGLDPTVVPWSAVESAWMSTKQHRKSRKSWVKETFGDSPGDAAAEKAAAEAPGSTRDTVVENLKNDPDLDPHEARLLPCIVDASTFLITSLLYIHRKKLSDSIATTFSQVHLPSSTIDAVRTMASLRLLHPHAFQHGILKEHGMTGCLLFWAAWYR